MHVWILHGFEVNAMAVWREVQCLDAAYETHDRVVSTGIDKDSGLLRAVMWLARPFAPNTRQAAATSAWVATAPAVAARGGGYFVDVRETAPARAALDPTNADRLWELTQRWVTVGP